MKKLALTLAILWPIASAAQVRVRQAGSEFTIDPIPGPDSVVDFYAYGSVPASANTGLEMSGVSLLFLYEQTGGETSLVIIHDEPSDPSGGEARIELNRLPDGLSYAVYDEPESQPRDMDNYSPDPPAGGTTTGEWGWAPCCR